VRFAVPTGNFGNVYAGHVARLMGLPIERLVIGTNRNDILWRFIKGGEMRIGGVEPSLSPSMDIQVSSNFERLYFELNGRDGAAVAAAMGRFRETGILPAHESVWRQARGLFDAHRLDDAGIEATIARVWRSTGEMLDPHSAVAVSAMQACPAPKGVPSVALACAHPAKFPDVVERATGRRPALPPHLADLMSRPERTTILPPDLAKVRGFIEALSRRSDNA
jgi:threonine synthase